jgi:putative FmdB family regulatory protein
MPTYQYACTECGERLEVVQKFSDDPLTVCPACSGRLRKVFSAVGVVFKGSGFYKTDSRSSGSGAATKPAKAGSAAGSGDGGSTAASGADAGTAATAAESSSGTASSDKVA